LFVLGTAGVLLFGACGGGDDDSSSDGDAKSSSVTDSSGDDAEDSDSSKDDAKDSSDDSKSESSGSIPVLGNYSFEKGKASVRVSGDEDFDFELEGSSITIGGRTVMTFVSDEGNSLTIGLGKEGESGENSGFALTSKKFIGGGSFEDGECTIDVDDNESSKLSGSFECNDLEGADPSNPSKSVKVDVEGEFDFAN
jgi:hypothetical protein